MLRDPILSDTSPSRRPARREREEASNVTQLSPAHPHILDAISLRDDLSTPLYQQLEEQLQALVESGRLPMGSVLPAERQLAESLGISRVTVQRAYGVLRQRQLVTAKGRKGFIVNPPPAEPIRPGMDRLKGFTEEMRELGKVPSSRIIGREVVEDRSISSIFGLPSTAPFLKLTRIRYGDDVPLSREIAWYSLQAAPALEHGDLSGSVYAFLADHCDAQLVSCEQTIEATTPTFQEREVFGFDDPVPCLLIKRHSYTRDRQMVEYVEGLFRGDLYRYRLKLSC